MLIKAKCCAIMFFLALLFLSSGFLFSLGHDVPYQKTELERCLQRCRETEKGFPGLLVCAGHCERKYGGWDREGELSEGGQGEHSESGVLVKSESANQQQEQTENPYFFRSEEFASQFKSEEGHLKLLHKFSKKSKLLEGIENYRLAICEANPNTFVVPHHSDAEKVVVILQGKGTVFFVFEDRRESYNVERGDVIRVPAGITLYSINRDNREKLRLVMLARPINTPGKFREYFTESYYRVFSNDILETALNTPRDQLDKLFGQQKQGFVRKAPQEQLKALSERATSEKQRGHEHWVPSNLLHQQPIYSNNYGRFFEASPDDWKQLQDIDVSVSFAEIKQGALMVPHYNSKTTTIVLVLEGSGRFEMACPHLARQSQESKGRKEETKWSQYQKMSSHLSPGDIFIIPAGHPIAVVASGNENLWTVGFGINAQNNHRNFLAGGDNIVNQIDREAKELSFNVPADLVERIFRNQKESHFVACRREEGRGQPLSSVLDFAAFF